MKILGTFLKILFAAGTVLSIAVMSCASTALFQRDALSAMGLLLACVLLAAGAACFFTMKRRAMSLSLLFAGAALCAGIGVWLLYSPVGLRVQAFGWYHLSAFVPPLLALSGDCFCKLTPRVKTKGKNPAKPADKRKKKAGRTSAKEGGAAPGFAAR